MRAGRLVDMLLTLQRRGRMTAAELAAELEVSTRTILRDVDALSSAGVPIYAVQGVGGGIELVDDFRTRLTALTADEAAAVFLAGQPVVADHLGRGAAAAAARRKLLDALPDVLRSEAEALDGWFLHDPVGRAGRTLPYGELRRLGSAIERSIEIDISLSDGAPQAVRPVGVVLEAGSWLLVVLGDDGPQLVRIDDLRGLRLTRRAFARPTDFDLPGTWRRLNAGPPLPDCQSPSRVTSTATDSSCVAGEPNTTPRTGATSA